MAFVVRGVKEGLAVDAVTRYPTAPLTLLRLQSGSSPADVYPARCVLVCEEISIARIADVPVGQLAGGEHGDRHPGRALGSRCGRVVREYTVLYSPMGADA